MSETEKAVGPDEPPQSLQPSEAESRIGSFNPSDDEGVFAIKHAAKAFIATIDAHCPNGRRKSKAMTDVETAAMYAVKSIFQG